MNNDNNSFDGVIAPELETRSGRADFWRGFIYGSLNTLVLTGMVALVCFLIGVVDGALGR